MFCGLKARSFTLFGTFIPQVAILGNRDYTPLPAQHVARRPSVLSVTSCPNTKMESLKAQIIHEAKLKSANVIHGKCNSVTYFKDKMSKVKVRG